MLLDQKIAVSYRGGPISRVVTEAFIREGDRVWLAGRNVEKPESVVASIDEGPAVRTAFVDALDETLVDDFVNRVASEQGQIDIPFTLIDLEVVQQLLMDITAEEFIRPVSNAVRSPFFTIRAAARHMTPKRAGAVLLFGGGGPTQCLGPAASRLPWTQSKACDVNGQSNSVHIVSASSRSRLEVFRKRYRSHLRRYQRSKNRACSGGQQRWTMLATLPRLSLPTARTITASEVTSSSGSIVE